MAVAVSQALPRALRHDTTTCFATTTVSPSTGITAPWMIALASFLGPKGRDLVAVPIGDNNRHMKDGGAYGAATAVKVSVQHHDLFPIETVTNGALGEIRCQLATGRQWCQLSRS